jgi:ATP-dependent DNA helicase RecG
MTPRELTALLKKGEGQDLEFKRSTGELKEAMQTLCAFLNGAGGTVLFGVRADGTAEGQDVTDQTIRDIAQAADRLEPPAHVAIQRVKVKSGREVIVCGVEPGLDTRPFTYEGRAYERVGATTPRMPQAKYEKALLDRAHGKRRWENEPADGVSVTDIDRHEVFRILEAARAKGHLVEPVGSSLTGVLDRLNVRRNGQILQAAMVLFGKEFMPDYPQCELRMARFRGLDKTEFLDQRSVRGPAFKLLEEAELFCQRHFPLPGRILPGKLQREDRPLIPPDAMREILVNALIHRDYSNAGGAVYLAIYDDRVEVWSTGTFPNGIRPEMLSREHKSVLRNPIIADVFHRAGLIEKWGRGTNRVIAMCRDAGIPAPEFEETAGAAVVRFRVKVGPTPQVTPQVPDKYPTSARQVLTALAKSQEPLPRAALQEASGLRDREHFVNEHLKLLVSGGLIEMTIAAKPRSSRQKYRLTDKGRAWLIGGLPASEDL